MSLSETDKKVILAFAKCDMNISNTSRAMYMHRNTIVYHIEKIQKETGLDPKRFYDLKKLVDIL